MAGSLIEILDTKTRDNYNKIVIHKKMWIPVVEVLSFHSQPDAANTCVQNQKEKLKHPKLIKIQDTRKSGHLKPALPSKPAVPPKPVLNKNLGLHIPENQRKKLSNHANMNIQNIANNAAELPVRVNKCESEGNERSKTIKDINQIQARTKTTKDFSEIKERGKDLREVKYELILRMRKKVNILNDDKMDILKELSENKCDLDDVVTTVEELGSMTDVDKLKVHIKELESLTRLLTVLKVRVETAENKLKIARDVEKNMLQAKISKLSSQCEEAQKLKEFRIHRGEAIFRVLSSYLDPATLDQLSNLLSQKVNLISEFCKLEEKIQLGEQQISALDKTEMYNRL